MKKTGKKSSPRKKRASGGAVESKLPSAIERPRIADIFSVFLGEEIGSGYFSASRHWANGILMILPLLLLYELGVLFAPMPSAAAADFFKGPFGLLGRRGALVFNVFVVVVFAAAAIHLRGREAVRVRIYPLMMIEAALYALMLGPLINLAFTLEPARLFELIWPRDISLSGLVISAGAGVYEELLFRGLLLLLIFIALIRAFTLRPLIAFILAMIVSAAVFSALHLNILGLPGDMPSAGIFLQRLLAGGLFTVIFVLRGLGVACYAHAFYNIIAFGVIQ